MLFRSNNIHFIPFCSHKEIIKIMRCSDLFILPTRYDIWGLVVNEALSQGLPVITTTTCGAGLALIRNAYNGFIIPPDKPSAISDLINNSLTNHETLFEMSKNSLSSTREYTIENMARTYIDALKIYTQLNSK